LNDEIKSKLNFYIRAKKKNINQNNEDQIEKYNTINLNRMMKLKIDKTFIKGPMKKKNKNQLGTNNICQIGIDRWNWKQIKLL